MNRMYSKCLKNLNWINKKYSFLKNKQKSNNLRYLHKLNSNLLFNSLRFCRLKVKLLNYQQINNKSRLFHVINHLFSQILKIREITNLTIQFRHNRKLLKIMKTINKNRLQPLCLMDKHHKHKPNHPCW